MVLFRMKVTLSSTLLLATWEVPRIARLSPRGGGAIMEPRQRKTLLRRCWLWHYIHNMYKNNFAESYSHNFVRLEFKSRHTKKPKTS
jgi:hypothetical protein